MNKSFVKKVLAVVLGLSLIIMIYSTISLITEAIMYGDIDRISKLNNVGKFIKLSSVGLICMLIPTLVSYVFAFFSKRTLFTLLAAILSFIAVICCIAFIFIARGYGLVSSSQYTTAATYISSLIQVGVACMLIGVYFSIVTAHPKKPDNVVFANKDGEVNDEKN